MSSSPGRGASARLWRLLAGTVAGVLILSAILLGALRLALARVPENAARIQAWIEQQTGYRLEFRGIDARMRWWGPEVVLLDARVIDRDDPDQALFAAREGAVSIDVWNLFRTGELVAGRVRIVGPTMTVVRLADGRVRLLGQRERPADRPPFDLDRLPAGRLEVTDATLHYRDLKTGRGPWTLRRVEISLRRAQDAVDVAGAARLPAALGTDLSFEGRLRGSLDRFVDLELEAELRADQLVLAGLGDFVPEGRVLPVAGAGPVEAAIAFDHGRLQQLRLDLDLDEVRLTLPQRAVPPIEAVAIAAPARPPDASPLSMPVAEKTTVEQPAAATPGEVSYQALSGRIRLRREGEIWVLRASDLQLRRDTAATASPMSLGVRWRGHPASAFDLGVTATALDAAEVWPLVLALAPASFDRWAGLDPHGVVRSLRAEVRRERAGSRPRFQFAVDVDGLAVRPVGRWPGLAGLTARASGTDQRGRIAVRARAPAFEWPRMFREAIVANRLEGDVDWRRQDGAWLFESAHVAVDHAQAGAEASFELQLPGSAESPHLDLEARIDRGDAALTPHVLPVGRLRPTSIAWLERAFIGGSVSAGELSYHGPVRKFPFRGGEGEFRARAEVSDAALDYFPGFAPLTGGRGVVEFHNAGIEARVDAGEVGGIRVDAAHFQMADYREPVLEIDATGSGDLAKALALLQGSPLGPVLGNQFMQLSGRGAANYELRLRLPTQDPDARDYRVRTTLHSATVDWPLLRAPAQRVTGELLVHNREISARTLRGVFVDGPFEAHAEPGPVGGEVSASVLFSASGRAAGARLPGLIGLPEGIRMSGVTDWQLNGNVERRGEPARWPARVEITSDLRGLGIDAPAPFAKPAVEPRPTRVVLEVPGEATTGMRIDSGSARAALLFAERGDRRWGLERGTVRFDGQAVALPVRAGLHVGGEWPEFDLGDWLALRSKTPGGRGLTDWLGPVDVHLDRATVLGFEFHDVAARLESLPDAWRVTATGPMAEGTITVPLDLQGSLPLRLDMRRLQLQSPTARPAAARTADSDPRELPAIEAVAEDFSWQGRRFGRLSAEVEKVPQGLRLNRLTTSSNDFKLNATGSWLAEAGGPRTRIALEADSDDLAAASRALGYRDAVEAENVSVVADCSWSGGPGEDVLGRLEGTLKLHVERGRLRDVEPGAGRILGLLSVVELPRRLAFDFRDVTEQGLAFDKVHGDFQLRGGSAYTKNLLLKGPAVDIGVVGRTGLVAQDYDQTVVVSGNPSGPITVAGALAGGPVGAAGALLISQLFKGQLQGLARAYYRVTGPWSQPKIERISAAAGGSTDAGSEGEKGESR